MKEHDQKKLTQRSVALVGVPALSLLAIAITLGITGNVTAAEVTLGGAFGWLGVTTIATFLKLR